MEEEKGDWRDLIKDVVRRRHRNPLFRLCARTAEAYLRAHHNENHYRFSHNGERFVLETFKAVMGGDKVVAFDVGAHFGLWTRAFLERFPEGCVHCFEIAPPTLEVLKGEVGKDPRVHINGVGLSAQSGTLSLQYSADVTTASTVHTPMLAQNWHFGYETMLVRVTTGDAYIAQANVDRLDILKVDTEGHDLSVLKGFAGRLADPGVPLIQFEHGFVHIPARSLLCDFYDLLKPLGYVIGRLHPRCVDFKDYDLCVDEQFRMGNYIAVHQTQAKLIAALRG
jgi:FkbM family methyltransferase